MIKSIKLLGSSLIFLISLSSFAQKTEIIKDTVFINKYHLEYEFAHEKYFILEELNIPKQNQNVYLNIQKAYNIFNDHYFDDYNKRIQVKKDSLIKQIKENTIRENNYAFEIYTIYYDQNHLLNISVGIQIFGSPWEDIKYFTFDMKKDENIGTNLFKNQDQLLQLINNKILETQGVTFQTNDFSNYQIITDDKGILDSVIFIITNEEKRTNNRYLKYNISFSNAEIKSFISDKYKNRLLY